MASERAAALLGAVAVAACGFDAEPAVHERAVRTGEAVVLEVVPDPGEAADADRSWVLEEAPEGSQAELDSPRPDGVTLVVDRIGTFVVDRWVKVGTSDSWTDRFYVDVASAAPIARITGPEEASAGDVVDLSGATSDDRDGDPLAYRWRLALRPRDSVAELDDPTAAAVSFEADRAGLYQIELAVFDGETWGDEPALHELSVE